MIAITCRLRSLYRGPLLRHNGPDVRLGLTRFKIVIGYLPGYSPLASLQALLALGLIDWLFELDLPPDLGPIL